jgi:large subunit ribosomal protein L21
MFAVIKTGGKQYKVATNDIILVEKLDAEEGANVTLGEVLMVGEGGNMTVGSPNVAGASVTAKVLEQRKADKVLIFKKNRRHNYRRKRGHRQLQTVLRITDIKAA